MIRPELIVVLPSQRLRGFISHYWMSLDNLDRAYSILPDGAVDLVINQSATSTQSWVYGTSTSKSVVALEQHTHYLGIRFNPGQSRHFMRAAANELTDRCEPAKGLLSCSLDSVFENIVHSDTLNQLNTVLESHIAKKQPVSARIDDVVAFIEGTYGTTRIDETAATFGISRRQLERTFLETVGVPPKLFCSITRFNYAVSLIQQTSASLADVALESGYSDQSHMSHEFRRLANLSPAMYMQGDVAFLQDVTLPSS